MIEIDFHIFGLAQPPNRWFYCLANECWFGLYASLICSHPMKPSSSHTALAGPSFSNRPPTLLGTAGRTARGPNRTLAHFVGPKMGQFSTLCPDDGSFHEVISHRILGYPIFRHPPGDWEMIRWDRYPSLLQGGSQTWPAAISVRIKWTVDQNLTSEWFRCCENWSFGISWMDFLHLLASGRARWIRKVTRVPPRWYGLNSLREQPPKSEY